MQALSIKFRDEVCRKTHSEHLFPELPNIYVSRDIKPVSELYGQSFVITSKYFNRDEA
jgi:hypothetical protein